MHHDNHESTSRFQISMSVNHLGSSSTSLRVDSERSVTKCKLWHMLALDITTIKICFYSVTMYVVYVYEWVFVFILLLITPSALQKPTMRLSFYSKSVTHVCSSTHKSAQQLTIHGNQLSRNKTNKKTKNSLQKLGKCQAVHNVKNNNIFWHVIQNCMDKYVFCINVYIIRSPYVLWCVHNVSTLFRSYLSGLS
jgi:hypothetical protein